jgi:hypothetical protein
MVTEDPQPHVVRQGESLVTLAVRLGFDPDQVWNNKANASLRALRGDPHVLAMGDVLYIPPPTKKWLPLKVGAVNRFVATVALLQASIRCIGSDGKPIAGKAFLVDNVDPKVSGTTDGDGVANFSFPANLVTVYLHFPDIKFVVVAKIAHLDPITEQSGVEQRLRALGLQKPAPGVADEEAQRIVAAEYLAAALCGFQKQQGLPETGVMDGATLNALKSAHGA